MHSSCDGTPFPVEPHHGNIDWLEEDNTRNQQKYGIAFEDILSGFAKPHARFILSGPHDFVSLIEVQGLIFEVRCKFDLHLILIAADVAKTDAEETYYKTLSQSDHD